MLRDQTVVRQRICDLGYQSEDKEDRVDEYHLRVDEIMYSPTNV